jgi:hypothetical protein
MDITGPHDSAADDDTWRDMVDPVADRAERLGLMAGYSCRTLARAGAVHAIVRCAADQEPLAAGVRRRLLQECPDDQHRDGLTRRLHTELPGAS